MILDVDPEEDEEDDEEEEEEEADESVEGEDRLIPRRPGERRHNRIASDLSVIESSAELLYGLIHQRYICSRAGIQQMSEKYELAHFGNCPRTNCIQTRTLPVGLSDIQGEDTVKLFCPSCCDVYVPPNSRFQTVDGAFFGRTFGALFLMTFPDYDVSKKATDALTSAAPGSSRTPVVAAGAREEEKPSINGMLAHNLAPGLGRGKIYEPRIYGFRVSERARSGPRMQWLRSRPDDVEELNEVSMALQEGGDESDEDDAVNGGGPQRKKAMYSRRRKGNANGGSPMVVDGHGEEFA